MQEVSLGIARYILEKTLFVDKWKGEGVECVPCEHQRSDGRRIDMCLNGLQERVRKALAELKDFSHKISARSYTFRNDEQKAYYSSNEGRRWLEELQKQHDCTIMASERGSKTQQNVGSTSKLMLAPKVVLKEGDIANVQADVIVNITSLTNRSLKLDGSAISRSLTAAGGPAIQEECGKMLPVLTPGSVVETTPGNLDCQRIFHGVVEEYNEKSEDIVRKIVSQCLKMARTLSFRSIAFPAIATEGFEHPARKVARIMREEIFNCYGANTLAVNIVLHPRAHDVVAAFKDEFNQGPSSAKLGPVYVCIDHGDITKSSTDAIINCLCQTFDLSKGGALSQYIASTGGDSIKAELSLATGFRFRVTSGGELPCKEIIHMLMPQTERDICKVLLEILKDADQRGVTSITVPAIRTGKASLTSSIVSAMMKEAFQNFARTRSGKLHSIKVVIFDRESYKEFKAGILGASNEETKKMDIDSLKIFSIWEQVINKMIRLIDQHWEEVNTTVSVCIADDAIERFSDWEKWEVMRLESNEIELKFYGTSGKILIKGLASNVEHVEQKVREILKEFQAAEKTSASVIWQESVHGNWKDYHERSAHMLEKAFQERVKYGDNPPLKKIRLLEWSGVKVQYSEVDLTQLDGRRKTPSLRRVLKERKDTDLSISVLPKYWRIMGKQKHLIVIVDPSTVEYDFVTGKFKDSGGQGHIVKVERIQSEYMYKQFVQKKEEVTEKKTANPVTRMLFHGTNAHDEIVKHGFDRGFAGKNAVVYGRGVYFAISAADSHKYTQPDASGNRKILLAEVITGDYCRGHHSYKAPPNKNDNDLYDSCVNDMQNPCFFVIFRDASAYPQYSITYKV